MGRLKNFQIVFINNKTVYHPGEKVSGQCVVESKGDVKLRALRIYMKGVVKVHWTESRSTGTRLGNYTEHFNSEVEYFSKKQTLFGRDTSDSCETLEEGTRNFSFSFTLPSDGISTSFEGKHGNIRYWLKAEMEKPWSFNSRTKKFFTVISPIDINKPNYRFPMESNVEKNLCCWICTSGPVTISARTDRTGYCPGESIAISAEFENHTRRTVVPYASLHQTQTFYANRKSRTREAKFTMLTGLPVSGRGTTGSWDAQLLKIPAVSPTILNCRLIRVEYYVKVAVHISAAYNLNMYLPIVMGTVPFIPLPLPAIQSPVYSPYPYVQEPLITLRPNNIRLDVNGRFGLSNNSQHNTSEVNDNTLNFLCNPPEYRESLTPPPPFDGPPGYAECVSGSVSVHDEEDRDGDTMGDMTFTPLYVYNYHFRRSPPPYAETDPNPQLIIPTRTDTSEPSTSQTVQN